MARYNGPKARINRRLNAQIFENSGAVKAFGRRPQAPGMARPRGRKSVYGQSLAEKQKIKYFYGLGERQIRKFFDKAKRQKGNTGENLLILCERRFDNVVRRAGFTRTRPQARQGIGHGHFCINGRKNDIASTLLRPGDVITIHGNEKIQEMYKQLLTDNGANNSVSWFSVDPANMSITVLSYPTYEEVALPVEIEMVIELMNR